MHGHSCWSVSVTSSLYQAKVGGFGLTLCLSLWIVGYQSTFEYTWARSDNTAKSGNTVQKGNALVPFLSAVRYWEVILMIRAVNVKTCLLNQGRSKWSAVKSLPPGTNQRCGCNAICLLFLVSISRSLSYCLSESLEREINETILFIL